MKVYTIIGGVNGVGKSSFSGVLRQQRLDLGKIIDPDHIAAKEHCFQFVAVFIDPDHIAAKEHCNKLEAGRIAIQEVETAIQNGWNFTQETTLSGRRTLQTILAARQKDYQIRLYYIGISSAEESLYRIANRVRKGGHNIAEADVRRRYEKRFADLSKILPYCDEAHFFDNENGFTEAAIYQNGSLIPVCEVLPQWLQTFRSLFLK